MTTAIKKHKIMKNIVLLLTLIVAGGLKPLYSQEIVVKKDTKVSELKKEAYYKIPDLQLERFEGTWLYEEGNKTFTIILTKEKTFLKGPDVYMDRLNGIYCYKEAGMEIDCPFEVERKPIYLGTNSRETLNRASFSFYDTKKEKRGEASLELLEDGTAHWRLGNKETIIINGKVNGKNWDRTFSVPTNVIMTKVK